jgi:hypothetical protein
VARCVSEMQTGFLARANNRARINCLAVLAKRQALICSN